MRTTLSRHIARAAARGMSLAEVLISIAIMSSIILVMLGLVPYSFKELQVNSAQVQAVAIGQQFLDAMRNARQTNQPLPSATTAPIDQGSSFISGSTNAAAGVFTLAPNACPILNSSTINQYDCAVTVSWTEENQSDSVTVESYVTAP